MSDIKLFKLTGRDATELDAKSAQLEKHLQDHVEANMEALIGVRFLAREYAKGRAGESLGPRTRLDTDFPGDLFRGLAIVRRRMWLKIMPGLVGRVRCSFSVFGKRSLIRTRSCMFW